MVSGYDYDSDDDSSDEEMEEFLNKNKENKGANLIVSQPEPFTIAENVEACVNHHTNKDDNSDDKTKIAIPHEEYQTVTISSESHSMDEFRGLLNEWLKEYR